MMSKERAVLLSVFLLFKFFSKDLIIPAFIACSIHVIDALLVMLPPSIKHFLTKECNYKDAVSWTPLIHVSVDFVKSRVLASIPGFFFRMWYAAKKYCLANNVLGISSHIQGVEMLSLGPLKTLTILPVWVYSVFSLLTSADTVIPGIFVALALPGVIGFVAVHCLRDGEVKQDDTNQLMGKVWDWNMYGAKLKFDGWVPHTANEDGERGEDDATALPENGGDGAEDGGDGAEDGGDGAEDGGDGAEDGGSGPGDGGSDPEDSNDDSVPHIQPFGQRAVQLLAICADFPICEIIGYDWQHSRYIYVQPEGGVQEEGMVDLVPIGPREILMAYTSFGLEVYTDNESGPPITDAWVVDDDEEIEEYTQTICAGPSRKLEITYLVIPSAIEAKVEVKLKLKDIGSRSRAIYGKIKASATDYRNKSVHLFSCERGRSLSFPSGSTSILLLRPCKVAVPSRLQLELNIEVDLAVITSDSQEEQDKNLKCILEFTREIMSHKREVDDDEVEVNIMWYPIG
ncbi:uncharacterized protein LOC124704333 isoform X2 [Lolium rigidum]|uniref:uncharacterized protein LOC124704333 isoform X2 n=1 Tax=Lolium rigidum TaxID=89674 RepID=UPI001F5DB551|nr:uncharacterized protein LOC124704333 isoform X2 [Lolium rigidum]